MNLYQYYVKNAPIDMRRGMHFYLNDLKNSYHDDAINGKSFLVREATKEQKEKYFEMIYWEYENINRMLIKHKIYPIFDTTDLRKCMEKRDELLKWYTEEEIMEKYNLPRFCDYVPEEYENDLNTPLEVYTNNEYIKKALQMQSPTENNFIGGFIDNVYVFVNLMLLNDGLKPIFENTDDLEKCDIKRKEILKLMPRKEAFEYWEFTDNNTDKEIDYKQSIRTIAKCYKIEKYLHYVYGTCDFGKSCKYGIGWRIRYILSSSIKHEDKKRYLKEIYNISEHQLFDNYKDIDECIKFINENLVLVPVTEVKPD